MSKQVWICETCLKLWKNQEAAAECESRHATKDKLSIVGTTFDASDFATSHLQYWPRKIRVLNRAVPRMDYDEATYELKHVGPKGC